MLEEEKIKNQEREFRERLNRIYESTSTKTQEQLSSVLGIKQSSISDAQRRGRIPDSWLTRLYLSHKLNPEWILYGAGSRILMEDTSASPYFHTGSQYIASPISASPVQGTHILNENTFRSSNISDRTLISVYSPHYNGLIDEYNHKIFDEIDKIPLPETFITNSIKVFKLFSKNMEPTITSNALIGIDTQNTKLISGEIYAFCLPPQGITVVRVFYPTTLQSTTELHINLVSDNSKFPQSSLSLKDALENTIGRVLWTMHYL